MTRSTYLNEGCFYHIYNRGVRKQDIFVESEDYRIFLFLYEKYVESVADTYSWVLMPNHFHMLVRIKEFDERLDRVRNPEKSKHPVRVHTPSQHFSNLFNAYAQIFNRRTKSEGCLFQRPFQRKLIDSEEYLSVIISYIHNNPVHHGFCKSAKDYPWSSFLFYDGKSPGIMTYRSPLINSVRLKKYSKMFRKPEDVVEVERWLRI
jgi:putative transposase